MTLIGRISAFFPIAHISLSAILVCLFLQKPSVSLFALAITALYLLPPFLFRLYSLKHPVRAGMWRLDLPVRSDWWIAHQLQMPYATLPALEAILRIIPGAYSAWLRLWGCRIGKNVHWTPRIDIIDRHLLSVGDNVVFGHRLTCTSHIITKKKNGHVILTVRPIMIGNDVVIGAGARIGPGVEIPDHVMVPYNAEYRWRYAA